HILLFCLKKGKNATQAREKICDVYGRDALSGRVCRKWFAKFRSGDFNVKHAPRSGRPLEIDKIKALVDANHQ
ncbi:Histone-lysine N-methyltransferase SETMAR, partial [Melipona quadrifasciata]